MRNLRLSDQPVFVFGSNLGGRHGKGAALYAVKHHGAIYGQGYGIQGNSFAIPTKNEYMRPMRPSEIGLYVHNFISYAKAHPESWFYITAIGCGLAGHSTADIAPFFKDAPENCIMPHVFADHIGWMGATHWDS